MTKATVSSKGQIAIPKAVRERLNLKAGTELEIDVQGQKLIMKRVVSKFGDWRSMEGMVKDGPSLTKALEEERAAENAHYEKRIRESDARIKQKGR
jgi:AbrB family looped-hinge helix DNA binding protein